MKLFPETRMIRAAKHAASREKKAVVTLLICLLVFIIGATVESLIITPCTTVWMLTDDYVTGRIAEVRQYVTAGDLDGYLEHMTEVIAGITANQPAWLLLVNLFVTAAVIAAVLIYALKIEKRSAESLGLHKRGAVPEYLAGLLVGAALFSGAVGICILSGSVTVTVTAQPKVVLILLFLAAFLVQGLSEELLCRGLLMVSLSRNQPTWLCILISSLLFAALHLGNPGISFLAFINLTLFGVFAAMYTLRRGSLWGIAALHSVWNFVQGNLWGISVSGMSSMPSFMQTVLGTERTDVLFNGGAFGLEGGIGVTAVLLVGIGVLLFIPTKRKELAPDEPVIPAAPVETDWTNVGV